MNNPYAVELLKTIFRHLKLELLTQFPASNDEKIIIFMHKYMSLKYNYQIN